MSKRFPAVRACGAALLAGCLVWGCRFHRDPVLAKVGKWKITESEFQRKLGEVAQEYQNYVQTPAGRKRFLDVLIREKMILAAATDSGAGSSPEFRAEMDRLRAEEAARLAEGRNYLLTRLWLDDLRRRGVIAVSAEEVRQYNRKHPYEVKVRHILFDAPKEAEAALHRLRGGANFAAMAKDKSVDADTAAMGGLMRPAIYGEIIPELEDVVFQARVGEIVGPVRSKFGYHVLRKESQRRIPFDEAESRIRRVLEKEKLDQYLQSLQSRYPVEVFDAQ